MVMRADEGSAVVADDGIEVLPEIRDACRPLNRETLQRLEDDILATGKIRDPIVVWVWNGRRILVDGHHRRAIGLKHGIPYDVVEIELADVDAAVTWVIRNQLGRRNLTPKEAKLLRGRLYNAEKNAHGGEREAKGNGCTLPTAERLATELGMSPRAIKNAGKFAAGHDRLKRVDPKAAEKLLAGASEMTDAEVGELGAIEDEELVVAAEVIHQGVKPTLPDAPSPASSVAPGAVRFAETKFLNELLNHPAVGKGTVDMVLVEARVDALGALDVVAEFAAAALKPDGVALVRVVQTLVPDAACYLRSRLTLRGIVACEGPQGETWTPFLLFGKNGSDASMTGAFIARAAVAKKFPDMTPDDAMVAEVLERYARVGDGVCVPMAGDGRMAVVAARLGRNATVLGRDLNSMQAECVRLGFNVTMEQTTVVE
jgi:hypothetical protein